MYLNIALIYTLFTIAPNWAFGVITLKLKENILYYIYWYCRFASLSNYFTYTGLEFSGSIKNIFKKLVTHWFF